MPTAYSNSCIKSYMFACNCFDEKSDGKEANRDIYETNSDMYDCIPGYEDQPSTHSDSKQNYICTERGPAYLKLLKPGRSGSENENTKKPCFQGCLQPQHITFPFSEFLKGPNYITTKENKLILNSYEAISVMFLLISKTDFAAWEVYLQNSKTGVMLHFQLGCTSESLIPVKNDNILPFSIWCPYQISFIV